MDRNLDILGKPITKVNLTKVNKSKQNDNWKLSETVEVSIDGTRKWKPFKIRRSKQQQRKQSRSVLDI